MSGEPQNQMAALVAVVGGGLAALGTFLDWFTIEIGGVTAPGGSATGWEGRDGRTVLAGAVVSVIAAALVALGSTRLAPKIALIVAGGVTSVIAIAGLVDTSGKADSVADEFAIPADRTSAEVGSGLWLVTAAGLAEVLAGVMARPAAPGTVATSASPPASSRRA